jgi:ankyrin repeat protein
MAISCGLTPKHQFTLLHLAAIGGHVESAKIVLERWPEMSIRDRSLDGRTPLMLAAAYNHEGMVKYLLSIDPEDFETLNAKAACGCTALASAINSGRTKIVELLVSCQGVRLNIRTCTRSPLSWAASEGHISLLRRFLSDPEIEVNAQHPFTGYTALCYACRLGCPEAVEILLSRKEVDVQSGPLCGCTPLLLAAYTNQLTIVSLLLSNPNINIHARCTHRGTAMSVTKNDTLLKLLLSHERILINATDGDVRLCLQHAARLGLEATFSKVVHTALQSYGRIPAHAAFNDIHLSLSLAGRLGLEDIFSKLVYGTLEPTGLKMRPIVLVEAARHGHAAVVEVALRFVDVNAKDVLGMTALDAAVQAGHTHIVSLLLSHKASVIRKPLTFNTPVFRSAPDSHGVANTLLPVFTHNHGDSETLFAACRGGIDEVVRILLLNPNINVNVGDDRGWTPLTHAAFNNHQNICHMLLSHPNIQLCPGNASPLVQAASRGHEKIVEMLLQPTYAMDINVNVEDARGWTPLAHAIYNNRRNICSMLLAHPEIQLCAGKAPLLVQAASRGYAEVVEMLLRPAYELGINVNMEDEHGWTPLAHAAWNNHQSICRMLLAHPKIQLCAGKASPLVRAAFRGHCQIVQMLLQSTRGLDTSVTEEGWSMLSAASYSGSMPLVQALLARDDIDVNLGRPPLIVAVVKGHIPIVKVLLAHCRTNVNIRDSSRHDQPGEPTALFFACRRGPPEAVQALLQHPDISVNVRLNKSSSPVSHTTQPNHSATNLPRAPLQSLEVVWRRDCPPIAPPDTFSTPLHVAARAVDWHEILLLLLEAKDLDLGTLNEKGESALALMLESNTVIGGNGRIALFPGFLKMVTSRYLASSPNAVRKEPDILRRAARTGNVEVVKALLEHCDSTMNLTPALTMALALRHVDIVSLLLDVPGIDPNTGNGLSHWHSPTTVKLLLDHPKINPNAVTNIGYTALAAACYHGKEEIVSWLLSTKGINVNAGKYHPLMLAVQAGKGRVVAQLMEGCTDIDVNQCAYSEEVLKVAGFFVPSLPPHFRWFRAKDCWLQQSAPVSTGPITVPRDLPSLNCFGRLIPRRVGPYAVGFSNGPVSRNRWYGQAYGSTKSREGDPILVHCTRIGNVGMSEAVLSHHAINVNARSRCGCTAFVVGSFLRRHTILDRILARSDTDPTIRCPTHGTAVLAAAHQLYFDTVNKIISSPLRGKLDFHETAGCGCNLFICAARSGDEETFLSFLSLTNWQDSPNTVDCKFGRTALLWASFYGQESVVQLLISNPVVDSNYRDKDGNNGVTLAVNSGREEVVRTFLASPGVNINTRNRNGDTALSLAVWHGYEKIVRLLLARRDVDVSVLEDRGQGPWTSLYL